MPSFTPTMSTDFVSPGERVSYWTDWIDRMFFGLQSDVYGDTGFDGHMATEQAGDVVLTRLEANRHRVLKSDRQAHDGDVGYLKIVAPYRGTAGVEQKGRQAWVSPGEWSIYDTTDSYRVANPVRVEHLIVMVPKAPLVERGLPLDRLTAQRLGAGGGISRLALQAMRGAWQELPSISPSAARGVGESIMQLVQLSLLELAGRDSAPTQREALRERIKQLVARRLATPAVGRRDRGRAQLQPAPALQRVLRRTRRRGRLRARAQRSRRAAATSKTGAWTRPRSPNSPCDAASTTRRTSAGRSRPASASRRASGGRSAGS